MKLTSKVLILAALTLLPSIGFAQSGSAKWTPSDCQKLARKYTIAMEEADTAGLNAKRAIIYGKNPSRYHAAEEKAMKKARALAEEYSEKCGGTLD